MAGSTRFFNRPRGRFFSVKDERRRIDAGMQDFQQVFGTEVLWYFLDADATVLDDVYDEGLVTGGKRYDGPLRMPVLAAIPQQGAEETDDQGFTSYDRIELRLSYDQARRAGLSRNLINHRELKMLDRFVFRNRVFDVTQVTTAGHFEQTAADTVISVIGTQLRPDELLDAPEFAKWSG